MSLIWKGLGINSRAVPLGLPVGASLVPSFLLLCFFTSGFSALLYEVVWTRFSVLVFGSTIPAVSTILAAYMAGLGLGSWWGGRLADRKTQLLKLYAAIELGIALFALLVQQAFGQLDRIYLAGLRAMGEGPVGVFWLRSILCFVLVLVPTTWIGATLPVMVRLYVLSKERIGPGVALLYACNTAGAVAGTLWAGFYLIGHWGLEKTGLLGILLNSGVALAAFLCSWRFVLPTGVDSAQALPKSKKSSVRAEYPSGRRLLLVMLFFAGFSSLAYEVLWTRILLFTLTSTVHSFATMLAAFLTGIALGSFCWGKFLQRRDAGLTLGWALWGTGFCSLLLMPLHSQLIIAAVRLNPFFGESGPMQMALKLTLSFSIMLVPTLLLGMVLPVVVGILSRNLSEAGSSVGRLYLVDTVGAIAGSLACGFLMIPRLGIQGSILCLAGLQLMLGGKMIWSARLPSVPKAMAAGLALLLPVGLLVTGKLGDKNSFDGDLRLSGPRELLAYREGLTATVSVVRDPKRGYRELRIDGFPSAGDSPDYLYMRMMAHLPLLLHPNPRSVLVLCFGTGTTAGVASLHNPQRLDVVDIDRTVLEFADFFSHVNYDVLRHPSARVFINDARNHVLVTRNRYDVITSEPLPPYFSGMANLYSREYYQLCSKILNPQGWLCQWLPFHLLDWQESMTILNTVRSVFPHTTLWVHNTMGIILAGREGALRIDLSQLKARMEQGAIRDDLREVGLAHPAPFLSGFVLNENEVTQLARRSPLITDNHPIIEFMNPRPVFRPHRAPGAWSAPSIIPLYEKRNASALPIFNLSPEEKSQIQDFYQFHTYHTLGMMHASLGAEADAARAYEQGLQRVQRPLLRADLYLRWGASLARLGNYPEAIRAFESALPLNENPRLEILLRLNLGKTYQLAGESGKAIDQMERILRLLPDHSEALQLLQLFKGPKS